MEYYGSKPANSGGGVRISEGDWMCSDVDCGNINFSRRTSCNRCGKERTELKSKKKLGTEIGKSAADKSRGLFSADDWQCSKCANVNWARRQTCNVCNAPKFGEVEARTGYGGGYNERGTVEYRPRRNSDEDEYDEFGRKKKRKYKDPSQPEKVMSLERVGSQPQQPNDNLLLHHSTPPLIATHGQEKRLSRHAMPSTKYPRNDDHSAERHKDTRRLSENSIERAGEQNKLPKVTADNLDDRLIESQKSVRTREHSSDNFQEPRYARSNEHSSERVNDPRTSRVPEHSAARFNNLRPTISTEVTPDLLNESRYPRSGEYSAERQNFNRSRRIKSPRECIMENRVSSTNEIKYRFTGRTIDENFEVVYTLEERIKAAAWAIAYQNCKISSERFQSSFDKPAPDFKTIFAWRQRLLSTGCLVDKHIIAESSGSKDETRVKKKLSRRKRRRYYQHRGDTTESSTDEEMPIKVYKRTLQRLSKSDSDKVIVLDAESLEAEKRNVSVGKQKTETEESDDSCSEVKESHSVGKTNANRNYGSSSNVTKQMEDIKNNSDSYFTDLARSISPEITNVKMDLANFDKSPPRVASVETQFHEDIYFDDDLPRALKTQTFENSNCNDLPFRVPEVPKTKVNHPPLEDSLKNSLEDIISESERYSSDEAASESDFVNKIYGKDVRKNRKTVEKEVKIHTQVPNAVLVNSFLKYHSGNSLSKPEIIDLPLPKFGQQKVKILSSETIQPAVLQPCTKNMSSAMRRIYESMSTQSNDKDPINEPVEYIPTKIDPAMAKRNHQLFKNDIIVESIHDIFADSNTSSNKTSADTPTKAATLKRGENSDQGKKTNAQVSTLKMPMFEDYLPDEDDLYKDTSSDGMSDSTRLKTPPRAPNISSFSDDPNGEQISSKDSSFTKLSLDENIIKTCVENKVTSDEKVLDNTTNVAVEKVPTIMEEDTTKADGVENSPETANTVVNVETNTLATLLNFNFSSVNANDLAVVLKSIQTLAEVAKNVSTDNCTETNVEPEQKDNVQEEEVIEITVEENKNDTIPFLSDMFDPGSPPNEPIEDKTEKNVPDLSNIQEQNLDDLLDIPQIKPSISGFRSFAIPKPIMLNRLRSMHQPKAQQEKDGAPQEKTKGKKGIKKKKKQKVNDGENKEGGRDNAEEEDEESDEEGDLSKYDLWGTDDEQDPNKDKVADKQESSSKSLNDVGTEKSDIEKALSPSPQQSKNSEDQRRSRRSDSGSGSSGRSSSSSSSSSDSSSGPAPRNRYDDFNLNSEHSRAGSVDSCRSRSRSGERRRSDNGSRDSKRSKSGQHRSSRDDDNRRRSHHRPKDSSNRNKHGKDISNSRRHHHSQRHRR